MAKQEERRPGPVDLFLVQHGQGEDEVQDLHGGWLDVPATPLGRLQAKALAERLLHEEIAFDALYSSTVRRAMETAEILGQALGLSPTAHEGLRPFNRGDLTGLTREEARRRFPGAWERPWSPHTRAVPNAETRVEFAVRACRTVDAIASLHVGQRVVLVTHAGVIRAALRRWLGISPWTSSGAALACGPGSITHLRVTPEGRPEIVAFNDRAHLTALVE